MKIVKSTMSIVAALAFCGLYGCLSIRPQVGTDYTPTGLVQSVTLKNTSIHFDPSVLKPGTPRATVTGAFGEPNETEKTAAGLEEDTYAFNPDGTKFVNPTIRPRNVALAVVTMGTSVAVHHARNHMAESKLTLYHVTYDANGNIESVRVERGSGAPENGPGESGAAPIAQPPAATP